MNLTVRDAAGFLGVSPGTVRRWCDLGLLPHYLTPGGQRRFDQEQLDAFVERRRRGGRDAKAGN